MAFVRVKGPDGSEFTIDERAITAHGVTQIDKDALDGNGRPLAPKYNIHKGGSSKAASTQKDG